jgi:hypothetical protein
VWSWAGSTAGARCTCPVDRSTSTRVTYRSAVRAGYPGHRPERPLRSPEEGGRRDRRNSHPAPRWRSGDRRGLAEDRPSGHDVRLHLKPYVTKETDLSPGDVSRQLAALGEGTRAAPPSGRGQGSQDPLPKIVPATATVEVRPSLARGDSLFRESSGRT